MFGVPLHKDKQKVVIPKSDIEEFWRHWQNHCPYHEAAEQMKHNPIGLFGDDARWSLSGSKIICFMFNHILDRRTRLWLFPLEPFSHLIVWVSFPCTKGFLALTNLSGFSNAFQLQLRNFQLSLLVVCLALRVVPWAYDTGTIVSCSSLEPERFSTN